MSGIDLQMVYRGRMNRIFAYIDQHLDSDLSLDAVADVACFSPFHFHRIFSSITGETLNDYVTRQRIERSAVDLLHTNISIAEVTIKNGFSCNSAFTRAFRKYYDVSPTGFRKSNPNKYSKIRQLKSKNGQVYPGYEKYLRIIEKVENWTTMNAKIEIRSMPEMHLAFIAVIGPQHLTDAYGRLFRWGKANGLMTDQAKFVTIYHDSLKITEEAKARFSACLTLSNP